MTGVVLARRLEAAGVRLELDASGHLRPLLPAGCPLLATGDRFGQWFGPRPLNEVILRASQRQLAAFVRRLSQGACPLGTPAARSCPSLQSVRRDVRAAGNARGIGVNVLKSGHPVTTWPHGTRVVSE